MTWHRGVGVLPWPIGSTRPVTRLLPSALLSIRTVPTESMRRVNRVGAGRDQSGYPEKSLRLTYTAVK